MSFPGREEALEILRGVGCSQGVVSHCLNVANLSYKLGLKLLEAGYDVDLSLVESGALLHDLGRSVTHSIQHGVVGADIARQKGLSIEIVRIIERHIGAGIPSDEANELGFPEGIYVPETLEEKLVAYADKIAEGAGEIDFLVTVERMVKELGSEHPAIKRMLALHEEIQNMLRNV